MSPCFPFSFHSMLLTSLSWETEKSTVHPFGESKQMRYDGRWSVSQGKETRPREEEKSKWYPRWWQAASTGGCERGAAARSALAVLAQESALVDGGAMAGVEQWCETFGAVLCKIDRFTKTDSGQTHGRSLRTKGVFCRRGGPAGVDQRLLW